MRTGWKHSTWGPRPWRGASDSTPSCWSQKRCSATSCSGTGQCWSEKLFIPLFPNLWLSHDNNRTAGTEAQTIIFLYTKARWPTKNERIRKGVTGYEGKSSWAALHVWAGEAGKRGDRMIDWLWKFLQKHVCYWQKNARAQAEQMFRNKLKKYGITELFIQQHGEGSEEDPSPSRLNGSADESDSQCSRYAKGEFLGTFLIWCHRFWENYV